MLRELALSVPTSFFQHVQQVFDVIFDCAYDSKIAVREGAASAIRVTLAVAAQRETNENQPPQWYDCFYINYIFCLHIFPS